MVVDRGAVLHKERAVAAREGDLDFSALVCGLDGAGLPVVSGVEEQMSALL
jgi:hypothetical protein